MARVTAIVNDLIFMTKIRNIAEYFGLTVGFVGTEDQIDLYLKDCELILIDLENDFIDSLSLIEKLKANPATASIKLIAYLSHVNTPLRAQALAAGCDEVLARFEFNSNMRGILQAACC
ncbi:MAG: response regulator [Bacteroidetes bacterium]|nr:response regulator [Bacteroidota bacterium]MCL5737902.1 response regulator [Bacteroidota bacterium]